MTNVLGMALMVLNVQTQEVVATNYVGQSCDAAGCTNWTWGEVEVEDKAAVYDRLYNVMVFTNGIGLWEPPKVITPAVTHKERRKLCNIWHSRPYTWTNTVIVTTVIGTKEGPLFDVVDVKAFDDPGRGRYMQSVHYRDGSYIQRHKEAP